MARDKGTRLLIAQIVHIGPIAAPDLQHIPKAFGGDERSLDPLALGNRVDDYCAAVNKVADRGQCLIAQPKRGHIHCIQNPAGEIIWRGRSLAQLNGAGRFVKRNQIGKGATNIGSKSDTHKVTP